MANPLRDRRSAAEWAASGQVIEIEEKLSCFEQLLSIVEADLAALEADKIPADWRDALVKGTLQFGFAGAERNVPSLYSRLTFSVDAVCQRCLEAFRLPLETEARLLLLDHQAMVEGYEDYEVWELEESVFQPLDIVEELLIMALPLAAMHGDMESCRALPLPVSDRQERTTPFANLRSQMKQD